MHERSSTLNNELLVYYSISTLLIHVYFGDFGDFHGDFGDFSIQSLYISMIPSISVNYPYLQRWFRWLLYPTNLYINWWFRWRSIPYPYLFRWFRWFPRWFPRWFRWLLHANRWFQQFLYPILCTTWWFRWQLYPTYLYIGNFRTLSLSILVTLVIFTGLSVTSQCNPSVHRWFQQLLYNNPIYNGDFGDYSTLTISTLVISIPYPYLFWWFRCFLNPTPLYIGDFNNYYTRPLPTSVISVTSSLPMSTLVISVIPYLIPIYFGDVGDFNGDFGVSCYRWFWVHVCLSEHP